VLCLFNFYQEQERFLTGFLSSKLLIPIPIQSSGEKLQKDDLDQFTADILQHILALKEHSLPFEKSK